MVTEINRNDYASSNYEFTYDNCNSGQQSRSPNK